MVLQSLTLLHERYRKNRINSRVIFGQPVRHVRRGWHSKHAVFQPEQVFGYERWSGNKFGTQHWSIHVGQAVRSGYCTRLPGIRPGADIWLTANGKAQVQKFFIALDEMNKHGLNPEYISEHRWRDLQLMLGPNGAPANLVWSWACS